MQAASCPAAYGLRPHTATALSKQAVAHFTHTERASEDPCAYAAATMGQMQGGLDEGLLLPVMRRVLVSVLMILAALEARLMLAAWSKAIRRWPLRQ